MKSDARSQLPVHAFILSLGIYAGLATIIMALASTLGYLAISAISGALAKFFFLLSLLYLLACLWRSRRGSVGGEPVEETTETAIARNLS